MQDTSRFILAVLILASASAVRADEPPSTQPFELTPDLVVRMSCATCETIASDNYNLKLDYTVASIARVEIILEKMHQATKEKNADQNISLVGVFGDYIGEVIRRQVGGTWQFPSEDMLALVLPSGKTLSLRPWAIARVKNGSKDSIVPKVDEVLKSERK